MTPNRGRQKGYENRTVTFSSRRPADGEYAAQTTTISLDSLPTEIKSINGFWLTPIGVDGEPSGATTYYPTEIGEQS